MNKVMMLGRLTRDPDISTTNSGTKVARFSIAVNRRYKTEGGPEADFFDCTAFGERAGFVEKYLVKGTKILVEGELQNNNYTNRDGNKVYSMRIMVNGIEFAESKKASTQQSPPDDGFVDVPDNGDDEIPFA